MPARRTMPILRGVILVLLAAAVAERCGPAHKPPNLSPAASVAWDGTKVIHALDVIRDIAIDGNARTPPIFSTATTRAIVTWHEAAITTVHAAPAGWALTVQVGLAEVAKALPPAEQQQLGPYLTLARLVLQELTR